MSNTSKIKLSGNENCYGCSPLVLEAILKKHKDVYLYPDVSPILLKEKLAEKFAVTTKNIHIGAGSVRIIEDLIQTFVEEEEEVLTFEKSFIAYGQISGFHKRNCKYAPLTDYRCLPENLIPLISDKTRLIFIANPNNPTGTIITHSELELLLTKISKKILVVIDEAYAEYVTDLDFPKTIELQKKHSNLVITRSFSKIYGLAGLRIGFAIAGEHLIKKMVDRQIPFSINYLSSDAAIASLLDIDFIINSAKENASLREYLFTELTKYGYNTIPTQSNFIYLWFNNNDEKQKIYDMLFQNGIIICDMKVFGQENSLRITIGNKETNHRIISIITDKM